MHSVRINIVEDDVGNITSWSFVDPQGVNNVSNPEKVFNSTGIPYKGFHLSKFTNRITSTLDGSYKLYSSAGYSGYVSRTTSSIDGTLGSGVTLNITLDSLPEYLHIVFDPLQGVMATRMTINGNTVTNNSYSMSIRLVDLGITSTSISIVFTKLNVPNNPLKITRVEPGLVGSFIDNDIQEITFASQLMDTSFNITPSVVEQYAKISLIDRSGVLSTMLSSSPLTKDLKVIVYVDDMVKYTYLTSIWDISVNSSKIVLECNDPCKKLANMQLQPSNVQSRTLKQLIQIAFTNTGYECVPIDTDTSDYMDSIVIGGSIIKASSVLDFLNDVCLTGLFRIFWDKDVFKIARCY